MDKDSRIEWLKQCSVKERQAYYNDVRKFGCMICCDVANVNLHHCTGHNFPATRSHRPVIPLCTNLSTGYGHHQGNGSIHDGKASFQEKYGTQDELLDLIEEKLERVVK